jgi:RNA 2',3'-cyclic 3'-phosphodiesterase
MFDQVEAHPLRLFFGLPLPGGLQEHLRYWQRTFSGIEGWSRPESLHLTLAFLGQRSAESLPGLERIAATVTFRHGAFVLRTATLGSFSRAGSTRLLWLGLAPAPALADLAWDLRGTLQVAGEAMDTKPFHPHVTLGRFRQAQPMAGFTAPPTQCFYVDSLTLFESRPMGQYEPLRTWDLRWV